MNPYDCSRPGNLFSGYEEVRRKIVDGLSKGRRSYSIQGGRRCGKSSLLLQIGKDLDAAAPPGLRWRLIDMQAVVPRSPAEFFLALYREIVECIPGAPPAPEAIRNYQEFLTLLDRARPALEAHLGLKWTVVLMIDDFDVAAVKLPDDEAFQNLRNLTMESRHARSLRLIAAGSSRMDNLIKAGSPLNHLDPVYLSILTEPSAREVLAAGFPDCSFEHQIFRETGRHPYILQGVLAYLWEDREDLDLSAAVRRFSRDRMAVFKQWMRDIGEAGIKVYSKMAYANGPVSTKSLKMKGFMLDDVLQVLSYHGLIDEAKLDEPHTSSEIFRNWFLKNVDPDADKADPLVSTNDDPVKRVFVVHGRNQIIRSSMFLFLRELGLQPLDWGDLVEATGNPTPTIIEILRAGFEKAQAAVVLFTPEDEARLRKEFWGTSEPEGERELTPQPRPNVIFEAGMVMAHFPRRTVIVQIGNIRPFTDLSGIHFVRLDNTLDARRDLLRRLRVAGCAIDNPDGKIGWHTAGNFDL